MNAISGGPDPATKVDSRRWVPILGTLYVILVGTFDSLMPNRMSFSLFYLIGVGWVAWRAGVRPATFLAILSALLMDVNDWHLVAGHAGLGWVVLWNAGSRTILFCGIAWCLARLTELNWESRQLANEKSGHYDAIMANAMDGVALVDSNGRVTEVNEAYCRMTGYSAVELVGCHISDMEMRESRDEIEAHIQRIRAKGNDRFETVQRRKDGTAVDVEVGITCLPGSQPVMLCFLREIGERKRAEARLRESEGRYRSLAEASPDAILVLNREYRVTYANSAAASPWNQKPGQLIGVSQSEMFNGSIGESHMKLLAQAFETGQPMRHDECIPFPTGDKWSETRLVPVPGPNGAVESVIVIAVDISERKRTEWLLQSQRDLGLKLSRTSDLDTALDALLEFAIQIKGVDCAGVYFADGITGELKLAAYKGPVPPTFIQRVLVHSPESERAQIVRRGQPVYDVYAQLHDAVDPGDRGLRSVAILPFWHEGRVLGSLHLGTYTQSGIPPQSRIIIEAVVAQAAGAIARIRSEHERQRLEHQILSISDREQARIGQEVHDGLCQQLVSLAFDANSLRRRLADAGSEEAKLAARVVQYLDDAITEARHLSRGLFPIRLDAEGLPSALQELARGVTARFGVACTVSCNAEAQLPGGPMAIHVYRIAQEAVTNALKHGKAKNIAICLGSENGQLNLSVEDDGIGFSSPQPASATGMGLHIMDYRARTMSGTFRCELRRPRGVAVSCCFPSLVPEKM